MLGDTIAAIASPPGAAARGVIRVAGPAAFAVVSQLACSQLVRARLSQDVAIRVRGVPVEALVLGMPAPGSYTGDDVVELHLPGSPLLLDCVLADLRGAGVRAATPGEFTRRAFEHGRIRLEQAEAIADLIAAQGDAARRVAVQALAGGLGATVSRVRTEVQDALALIEAGLDFADGDTEAVEAATWLLPLQRALEVLASMLAALPEASPGGELLLLGAANAGKSSLCNALSQREAALVDAVAGTTRDVLTVSLGNGVTLLDAPGDVQTPSEIDAAALRLRDLVVTRAAAALLVIDASAPRRPTLHATLPVVATVFTKIDLVPAAAEAMAAHADLPHPHFFVSSRSRVGLGALHDFLAASAVGGGTRHGTRRWRDALAVARAATQRAHDLGATGGPAELAAAELVDALAALDSIEGRSSAEDLLDRVFARFCLGK